MNKITAMVIAALVSFSSYSMAAEDEAAVDMAAIKAACTAEAKGAIDVKEYIDECVKDKMEEIKEQAKGSAKE